MTNFLQEKGGHGSLDPSPDPLLLRTTKECAGLSVLDVHIPERDTGIFEHKMF